MCFPHVCNSFRVRSHHWPRSVTPRYQGEHHFEDVAENRYNDLAGRSNTKRSFFYLALLKTHPQPPKHESNLGGQGNSAVNACVAYNERLEGNGKSGREARRQDTFGYHNLFYAYCDMPSQPNCDESVSTTKSGRRSSAIGCQE